MNAFKFLRDVYVSYVAKPVIDRNLDRLLRKSALHSLVQVGLEPLARTKRVLELAAEASSAEELKFACIDLFESRTDGQPGIGLKSAHKELKPYCGKLQLIPGDVFSALARSANSLTHTDLLMIGTGVDPAALTRAWFYIPRMLHDQSLVLVEEPASKGGETTFRQLTRLEVEQLASQASKTMRRAA